MKNAVLIGFVLFAFAGYNQSNDNTNRFSEILSHSIQTKSFSNSSIPTFIEFSKEKTPSLSEIEGLLNTFSRTNFTLKEVKRENDKLGFTRTGRMLEGETEFEETEQLEIKKLPFAEAVKMCDNGEITDSLSIAAIYRLQRILNC